MCHVEVPCGDESFVKAEGGNVAILFALVLVPILGIAGAALDMSSARSARAELQNRVDGAALAAAQKLGESNGAVKETLAAHFDGQAVSGAKTINWRHEISDDRSSLTVTADAQVETSLLGVMGFKTLSVDVKSEVTYGVEEAEIALALDVTGSMSGHVPTLRKAAQGLLDEVFDGSADPSRVRAAIIPYVTTVNVSGIPGHLAMMDTRARARFHGENFEKVRFRDSRCDPPKKKKKDKPKKDNNSKTSKNKPKKPKTPGKPKDPGTPPSRDLGSLMPVDTDSHYAGLFDRAVDGVDTFFDLIGPTAAQADPWPYGSGPEQDDPRDCVQYTPDKINHFDLFRAMDVDWRGCVEARPEPYDTADVAPNPANPDTLFVPYLWPDEKKFSVNKSHNSYFSEKAVKGIIPTWVKERNWDSLQQAWIWKYRELDPKIKTGATRQQGPNAACPDPIVPLTNKQRKLERAVAGLRSYALSGTNSSAGMAWAYRALTPGAPLTEAKPFDSKFVKKVIVLMTDGDNDFVGQKTGNESDYTGYGYLAKKRLGTDDLVEAKKVLNAKLAAICREVKAKPNEIVVFTVFFDPGTGVLTPEAEEAVKGCASRPDYFFNADSSDALITAFETIGNQINALRVSR
ncbi:MAG: TadE/TadG family type IV pilus assembly protein [Pseudomonadota bacterium]